MAALNVISITLIFELPNNLIHKTWLASLLFYIILFLIYGAQNKHTTYMHLYLDHLDPTNIGIYMHAYDILMHWISRFNMHK